MMERKDEQLFTFLAFDATGKIVASGIYSKYQLAKNTGELLKLQGKAATFEVILNTVDELREEL
jgi:hypothetical protein